LGDAEEDGDPDKADLEGGYEEVVDLSFEHER